MLTKFRNKHTKKILLGVLIVIGLSFILWGAPRGFKKQEENEKNRLTIDGKAIDTTTFRKYMRAAQLHSMLFSQDREKKLSQSELEQVAKEMLIFLWKAKKENIKITDNEVVEKLQQIFSTSENKFDQTRYKSFLKWINMQPREFEEHLRKIITFRKVLQKYVFDTVSVSEEEIIESFKADKEKIKLSIINIPFNNFEAKNEVTEEDIASYYNNNKDNFFTPEKIKLQYAIFDNEEKSEIIEKIEKELKEEQTLKTIAEKLKIKLTTTGYLDKSSSLKEFPKTSPQIINFAFSLPVNKPSPVIELDNKSFIFEKIEQTKQKPLNLEEAKEKVIIQITKEKQKIQAKELAEKIIKDTENTKLKLSKIAKNNKLEISSTELFTKRSIPQNLLTIDKNIWQEIFELSANSLYEKPVTLNDSVILIYLDAKEEINKEKLKAEKDKIQEKIRQQKILLAYMQFISKLYQEANITQN